MLDTGTASNQELAETNRRDNISVFIKSRRTAQKEEEEKTLIQEMLTWYSAPWDTNQNDGQSLGISEVAHGRGEE